MRMEFEDSREIKQEPLEAQNKTNDEGSLIFQIQKLLQENEQKVKSASEKEIKRLTEENNKLKLENEKLKKEKEDSNITITRKSELYEAKSRQLNETTKELTDCKSKLSKILKVCLDVCDSTETPKDEVEKANELRKMKDLPDLTKSEPKKIATPDTIKENTEPDVDNQTQENLKNAEKESIIGTEKFGTNFKIIPNLEVIEQNKKLQKSTEKFNLLEIKEGNTHQLIPIERKISTASDFSVWKIDNNHKKWAMRAAKRAFDLKPDQDTQLKKLKT